MPAVKWLMSWHPDPGVTLNNPDPGVTLYSHFLAEASSCAESLGGVKDGLWKTSMTVYSPVARDSAVSGAQQQLIPGVPRAMLGFALHERPGLYFSIIQTQRIVLQAEAAFSKIMEELQSYKAGTTLKAEGFQYKLGDFCVRIGKCGPNSSETPRAIVKSVPSSSETPRGIGKYVPNSSETPRGIGISVRNSSETLRGILMEVEYNPLCSIEEARAVMEDFSDIWQETLVKKLLPGRFIHVDFNFAEYGLSDHYSFRHTAVQYVSCLEELISLMRDLQKRSSRYHLPLAARP